MVTDWLVQYGFVQSLVDPGIFVYDSDGHCYVLAVYVDDCILVGSNGPFITRFKSDFAKRFKIEDLGPAAWLLGCSIVRDRSKRTLHFGQRQYFIDMLDDFGMSNCSTVSTPLPAKLTLTDDAEYPILDAKEFPYAKLVGKLLYASNCTRPDITASINFLSRYMSKPTELHWGYAKRLLRYIRGTLDYCLVYSGSGSPVPVAWQDASFADGPGRKSRTGFVVVLCGAAVTWGSRLQPTVALSTVEAEYMALAAAVQEVMFVLQLLRSIRVTVSGPVTVYEDNRGCISLATNAMTTGKTKHIDVKFHFVRELVREKKISVVWCESGDMLADILTKFSIPARQHLRLSARIMSGLYRQS